MHTIDEPKIIATLSMYDAEDPNEKKEFDQNMRRLMINFENMREFSCSNFQETEREITKAEKELAEMSLATEMAREEQRKALEAEERARVEAEKAREETRRAEERAKRERETLRAERNQMELERRQRDKEAEWYKQLGAGFHGSNDEVREKLAKFYPWKSGSW